jgi:hypothetical protein
VKIAPQSRQIKSDVPTLLGGQRQLKGRHGGALHAEGHRLVNLIGRESIDDGRVGKVTRLGIQRVRRRPAAVARQAVARRASRREKFFAGGWVRRRQRKRQDISFAGYRADRLQAGGLHGLWICLLRNELLEPLQLRRGGISGFIRAVILAGHCGGEILHFAILELADDRAVLHRKAVIVADILQKKNQPLIIAGGF